MDTPTLRILDATSSHIGDSLSINQLTKQIKDMYGSAYYANTYEKLQELKTEGLLILEPIGKSSSVKLNFENYLLIDALAEMEIEKKIDFLSKRQNILALLDEMDMLLADKGTIKSITAINPSKNIKLNRVELLFLLKETPDYLNQTIAVCKDMLNLEKKYNLKINSLTLNKNNFADLLTSDEINPVREALSQQITIYNPQAFWKEIKAIAKKSQIRTSNSETKPLNISDLDLTFNLNRFGYSEFGASFAQGKKYCIEYTVTSLLLREEARGVDAAAVILAKNSFNSNLLSFLSQKFQTAPRLLGILKVLQQTKPKTEFENTIKIISSTNPEQIPIDEASIKQKLELYNAL